ncbi:MAG: dihydroorotase family protein [Thaumarchaeota archaeon]|nr:dihydroorotase family protein [Nitrososphaerota archaeon]
MEHDLVLEGRVVTPDGIQDLEVGVSDGLVGDVGAGLRGARRIKTGRGLIFPGFIDIHVHLREPGWEQKEDFRTGTRAAVHGGVTTVVDMPNNPVPTTTKQALRAKASLAGEKGVIDVMFNGGISKEKPQSLAELSEGVVGYKLYLSETTGVGAFPEAELGQVFGLVAKTSKPLNLHCEDPSIIETMGRRFKGDTRADVYCDIRPPEAEVESVRKVVGALRETRGLRANVSHASVAGTLALVREARREKLKLHCEAALHHLYYNRKAMLGNRLLKTNPPLRSDEDRQALVDGIRNGDVSFLVTDHAPHLEDEKTSLGLAGVPGLDDYAHMVSWLIRSQGVDPAVIANVTSANPAKQLRLRDRGEIVQGRRADFTVIDMHSPETVRDDDVESKCGWSPYDGKEFPGRARWTISGGKVLMDDYELVR